MMWKNCPYFISRVFHQDPLRMLPLCSASPFLTYVMSWRISSNDLLYFRSHSQLIFLKFLLHERPVRKHQGNKPCTRMLTFRLTSSTVHISSSPLPLCAWLTLLKPCKCLTVEFIFHIKVCQDFHILSSRLLITVISAFVCILKECFVMNLCCFETWAELWPACSFGPQTCRMRHHFPHSTSCEMSLPNSANGPFHKMVQMYVGRYGWPKWPLMVQNDWPEIILWHLMC